MVVKKQLPPTPYITNNEFYKTGLLAAVVLRRAFEEKR